MILQLARRGTPVRPEYRFTRRFVMRFTFRYLALLFDSMTTTISSRGQTVIPAEIRARHHLTEKSRLAWIDDGQTIRVIPLSASRNPFGRGIAKDLDLSRSLLANRAKERARERRRRRS
jgi:AbrB family looped-hinge helix DNA binding protein